MDNYRTKTDEELQREVDEETLDAMREFDYGSAMTLMNVIEKQASVAPRQTSISGLAAVALNMLNIDAKRIAEDRAQRFNAKVAERTEAENERLRQLQQEEHDQAEANKAAAERGRSDAAVQARHQAEQDEAAKVPLTSEKNSPRAAPNPTTADNRRI